jgi:hypothetical protein
VIIYVGWGYSGKNAWFVEWRSPVFRLDGWRVILNLGCEERNRSDPEVDIRFVRGIGKGKERN